MLDLGSSGGYLATWYATLEPDRHVTASDASLCAVEQARATAIVLGPSNVSFIQVDLERDCLPAGPFDAVVEMHPARGETTKSIEPSHVFSRDRLRASRGLKTRPTGQRFFEGFEALHVLRRGHACLAALVPGHDPARAGPHERVRAVTREVTARGTRRAKAPHPAA